MMRNFRILAALAVAIPGLAVAQVGPNPAVRGGSQDPTVGGSTDTVTAPQDTRIGNTPGGNVLDRTIDTTTEADTATSTDTIDGSATTTVQTKTDTRPMKRPKR